MAYTIVVVDDYQFVRQGTIQLLSRERDFVVVGEAGDGFEAVELVRRVEPDLVLMEVYLPGLDGISAAKIIAREHPSTKVVMLSASHEEMDVLAAIQAGAKGYVPKTVDWAYLVMEIKNVLAGGAGLSEASSLICSLSHGAVPAKSAPDGKNRPLTPREKKVLEHIAQGKSNEEIADVLCISTKTVRKHVRSLMQKLALDNRIQLAVYGMREGSRNTPQSSE